MLTLEGGSGGLAALYVSVGVAVDRWGNWRRLNGCATIRAIRKNSVRVVVLVMRLGNGIN